MTHTSDDHGAGFLDRDFNQCFTQMRHYDGQIWEVTKFAFTAYTLLLGSAVGLYKYSLENDADMSLTSVAILFVGLLVGIFMYCLTIRNRVYFINVTRYVNEHRRHFLKDKPLGFQNLTMFYDDPTRPPYFDWPSSQLWLSYLLSLLNGLLAGTLIFIFFRGIDLALVLLIIIFVTGSQIYIGISYLRSREGKSAMDSITPTTKGDNT
jgi:hypothetical protein